MIDAAGRMAHGVNGTKAFGKGQSPFAGGNHHLLARFTVSAVIGDTDQVSFADGTPQTIKANCFRSRVFHRAHHRFHQMGHSIHAGCSS